ncbi:MAG: hypothetical protein R2818_11420 [Flavobacteriales bacterium]
MHVPAIAVVRGGYSGESVISHQSASCMLKALDPKRFDPYYVTLTRSPWTCERPDGSSVPFDRGGFTLDRGNGPERFGAALIAIHGTPGENGLLQGYLDMLEVPYQTGGVLNMSLTFSKYATTALLRQLGFRVAPSVLVHRDLSVPEQAIEALGLPVFVKPDQSGSSLGVSKVKSAAELPLALEAAFRESSVVMVEGAVKGAELTCGVLTTADGVRALPICEIRTTREFFDYEAKYHATDTEEIVPRAAPRCRDPPGAGTVGSHLSGFGVSRHGPGRPLLDRFGTDHHRGEHHPGFAEASIFPKMLKADGLGVAAAVNGALQDCLDRR